MATPKRPRYVWRNGRILSYGKVRFGPLTHALNYGTGVFDGIRAYWNDEQENLYIFRMLDHYKRFVRNWNTFFRPPMPYSAEDLCAATLQLLRAEEFQENIYIRPIALREEERIGVFLDSLPTVVIAAIPFGTYIEGSEEGITLATVTQRRVTDLSVSPRGKITGAYVNSHFAVLEAKALGADEALLLTNQGRVAEGSGENIFIVERAFSGNAISHGIRLVTPPVADDILPGFTRDTVLRIADVLGLQWQERSIMRSEVWQAEEVFLTGTACEIAPVLRVDGRIIGSGKLGNITNRIRNLFRMIIYNKPATPRIANFQRAWLTPVYGKENTPG